MKPPLAAVGFALVLSLAIQRPYAETPPPRIGPNIDITLANDANGRQQVETTIAIHPGNPDIIVAGAHDHRLVPQGGHRWHGYYRSVDGGRTWSVSLVPGFPGDDSPQGLSSALHGLELTSDPVLAFDRQGNVYYAGLALAFDESGRPTDQTSFVAKYVNDGADFAFVTLTPLADKPWIAVDTSGGVHDGNVYMIFLASVRKQRDIVGAVFVRSTDGGVTFSRPILLQDTFPTGITVDPAGRVYAVGSDFGGSLFVSRSDDGGATFHPPVTAASGLTPHTQRPLPGNGFRVPTVPQIAADDAGVYIVTDDFTNGEADGDILLIRSTDGGATWGAPVRVNDVTRNQQFFPSLAVAGGILNVIWYDARFGQLSDGRITALDVFYARSTDGGASFSRSLRVTSSSFDPNLVPGTSDFTDPTIPFMGDYIQVAAIPTAAHAIWADNRNACDSIDPTFGCMDQDVFTSKISHVQPGGETVQPAGSEVP